MLDIAEGILLSYRLDLKEEPRQILKVIDQIEEDLKKQEGWSNSLAELSFSAGRPILSISPLTEGMSTG